MAQRTAVILKIEGERAAEVRPASPSTPQSSPLVAELSPNGPAIALDIAPEVAHVAPALAPGVEAFNGDLPAPPLSPDLPAPRVIRFDDDFAAEDTRGQSLPKPDPARPPRIGRKLAILAIDKASTFFNQLAAIAVIGLVLLGLPDETVKLASQMLRTLPPMQEDLSSTGRAAPLARLVVEGHTGSANDPLPLGISLRAGSGGEIVTIAGLAEGTVLSLGTPLGTTDWLISARDLDKAFVGPPKNFVGVMEATAQLRSPADQLLDMQPVRFEWVEKQAK